MSRAVDVLIVGGGVAGAACATQLREDGFDGSVLLVTREPEQPYNRPPISKGYLTGAEDREAVLVHPPEWYEEARVEVLTRTTVTALDPAAKTAVLSTKDEIAYERALLATGAHVRRLPVEGSDLEGIHYLRALRNADVLRDDAADAERVVLVGGSYIGTEVAASLTAMGKQCAIVMQEDVTLSTGFGEQVGRFFQKALTDHAVEVYGGEELDHFAGSGERVERVVCKSGLELPADAVVLGVGAVPDVMLAKAAGLDLGERGGVHCDARLRTSAPDVWAAGDICEYDSVIHGRTIRIEHWDVAIEQGKHVARAMMGSDTEYDVVPYFFSDLSDWTWMEYVGPAASWDEEIVRGSIEDGAFTVFYADGGKVVAALTVGRSEDLDIARKLIREGGTTADLEQG